MILFVQTYSGYRSTRADHKGQKNLLAPNATDEDLGTAVLDALSHSRFVLGAPREGVALGAEVEFDMELYDYKKAAERYAEWTQDLMARYGYKTKRALFKDMKNVSIESKNGVMTFSPSHHEKMEAWGREKGRDSFEDVMVSASSTAAEIGAALRLAFSRCTG